MRPHTDRAPPSHSESQLTSKTLIHWKARLWKRRERKKNDSSIFMSVFPPPGLAQLVTEIAALLISRNETLCMAETACGGLMSASLLSKPGSSKFYRGGVTLYTLESRLAYGGWTDRDIETYRGPTPNIVENLARHVGRTLNATYCLAESGTAGPTGGHTPNRIP